MAGYFSGLTPVAFEIPKSLVNTTDLKSIIKPDTLHQQWGKDLIKIAKMSTSQARRLNYFREKMSEQSTDNLSILYAGLTDNLIGVRLSESQKAGICDLLKDKIEKCRQGYEIRLQLAVMSLFVLSKNTSELLYHTRRQLVEKSAYKMINANRESVHAYNNVFELAKSEFQFGIQVPNAKDDQQVLSFRDIRKTLRENINKFYASPFTLFNSAIKTLKSELAYLGYFGYSHTGYDRGTYEPIMTHLQQLFNTDLDYSSLLVLGEQGVADVNWNFIKGLLFDRLKSMEVFNISHDFHACRYETHKENLFFYFIHDPKSFIEHSKKMYTRPMLRGREEDFAFDAAMIDLICDDHTLIHVRVYIEFLEQNKLDKKIPACFAIKLLERLLFENKIDHLDMMWSLFESQPPGFMQQLTLTTQKSGRNFATESLRLNRPLIAIKLLNISASLPIKTRSNLCIGLINYLASPETRKFEDLHELYDIVEEMIRSFGRLTCNNSLYLAQENLINKLDTLFKSQQVKQKIGFAAFSNLPVSSFTRKKNPLTQTSIFNKLTQQQPFFLLDRYIDEMNNRIIAGRNYTSFWGGLFGHSASTKLKAAIAFRDNPVLKRHDAATSCRLGKITSLFLESQKLATAGAHTCTLSNIDTSL